MFLIFKYLLLKIWLLIEKWNVVFFLIDKNSESIFQKNEIYRLVNSI